MCSVSDDASLNAFRSVWYSKGGIKTAGRPDAGQHASHLTEAEDLANFALEVVLLDLQLSFDNALDAPDAAVVVQRRALVGPPRHDDSCITTLRIATEQPPRVAIAARYVEAVGQAHAIVSDERFQLCLHTGDNCEEMPVQGSGFNIQGSARTGGFHWSASGRSFVTSWTNNRKRHPRIGSSQGSSWAGTISAPGLRRTPASGSLDLSSSKSLAIKVVQVNDGPNSSVVPSNLTRHFGRS